MSDSKSLFKYEPQSLKGKGVVVTGGTTGIGRAIVLLLLQRGARVLTFGRHAKELKEAMADFEAVGSGEIHSLTADASRLDDIDRVFKEGDAKLGSLFAVINNAGLAAGSVMDEEPDQWQEVLDTNIRGYLACARAAGLRMKKQGHGTIVNIGSMSAEHRSAGSDIYVATKSAIRGFSQSLARQVKEDGIRVSLIEPGKVGADMTTDDMTDAEKEQAYREMKMLRAEELAAAVVFVLEQPPAVHVPLMQVQPLMSK